MFVDNKAELGGAIYGEMNVNITIVHSNFIGNSVEDHYVGYSDCCNSTSMYVVESTDFCYNFSAYSGKYGGAIAINVESRSTLIIKDCVFENNTAGVHGGALQVNGGTITVDIRGCEFIGNKAHRNGGTLFYAVGNLTISECIFAYNEATEMGGALYVTEVVVMITNSSFYSNAAEQTWGGALTVDNSTGYIILSEFMNNSALDTAIGGALSIFMSEGNTLFTRDCIFENNNAQRGGAIDVSNDQENGGHLYMERCKFKYNSANSGSAVYSISGGIYVARCVFIENRARGTVDEPGSVITVSNRFRFGGIMSVVDSILSGNTVDSGSIIYTTTTTCSIHNTAAKNNKASLGVLYFHRSNGTLSGSTTFNNNTGAFFLFNSNATFSDNTVIQDNGCLSLAMNQTEVTREGCAVTAVQSNIFFHGECTIKGNEAMSGAGIHATESKLYILGYLTVSENTATDSGGGIYLFQSEVMLFQVGTLTLFGNTAIERGGGLYASSSYLKLPNFEDHVPTYVTENSARLGGGMYLEVNTKLYVLKSMVSYHYGDYYCEAGVNNYYGNCSNIYTIGFNGNSAEYGGALFVADDTNSGITCTSLSFRVHTTVTECFLQSLALYSEYYNFPEIQITAIIFEDNEADRGSNIYGGLLDRCTVSPFAEVYKLYYPKDPTQYRPDVMNGVTYMSKITNIVDLDSISSGPVRICICMNGKHKNCNRSMISVSVKKGEEFKVHLVAVDQVNHSLDATVLSSLTYPRSGLGEGQLAQVTKRECTHLKFNVFSPNNSEELRLSALGPCKDAPLSQIRVSITFEPCTCPIGFQPNASEYTKCNCICDSTLYPYITQCFSQNRTLLRAGTFWVAYVNDTQNNISTYHYQYMIYPVCPLDYCYSPSTHVYINLNEKGGSDSQCNFDRSGILCGTCRVGLSLSLGSSRCIKCPPYWPLIMLGIIAGSILAGIALVAVLLVLNLTVAAGTINGIIFYANVVHAYRNTFLPFNQPNLVTVFISLVNMDFGLDICFFERMDTFWKTLLQLVFPLYVILLVIVVIISGERSVRFARLVGRRNPVATLATLILLSYTKMIQIIIAALSFVILDYPDGSKDVLWLPDAAVRYFTGKHVVLFTVAVFILLLGIAYTAILFSWQWLLRQQHKRIFWWVRYQRLSLFLEPYHAPYEFKYRYWTGILLMVRVFLYVISAVNVSGEPAVNLTVIGVTMLAILVLKGSLQKQKIYKKWPVEVLELINYINITLFTLTTLYTLKTSNQSSETQQAIAYTSVSFTSLLLLIVIVCHIFSECCITRCTRKGLLLQRSAVDRDNNSIVPMEHIPDQCDNEAQPTMSWVDAPSRTVQPLSALVEGRVVDDHQDQETPNESLTTYDDSVSDMCMEEDSLLHHHSLPQPSDLTTPLISDSTH